MRLSLLVHLELGVAVLEEGINLACSSHTSVVVGLSRLCAHLLRCREVAAFELLELVVGIGHDVGDELQVLALLHQLQQFGLVDDLLAGSVHQDAALLHLAHKGVVDALLRLGRCGDV